MSGSTSWMDAMPAVTLPGHAPDDRGYSAVIDVGGPAYNPSIAPGKQGSQLAPSKVKGDGRGAGPSWMDDMPAVTLPGQGAPSNGKSSGIFANLGAGTSEATAGFLGAPVDFATGAINAGLRGVHALAEKINPMIGAKAPPAEAPQITNPVGGSESLKSLFGLVGADPRTVVQSDRGDAIARAAGQGAASMVLPWGAARAIPAMSGISGAMQRAFGEGTAGGQAVVGAGAGVGGNIAEDITPDPWKPVGNFAGQIAGGGIASGLKAAILKAADVGRPLAANFVAPMTQKGQTRLAAERIGRDITDADAAREALAAPQELVPGSQPTAYQATGDAGIGGLERGISRDARYAPMFNDRRATQNNARVAAIEAQRPAGSDVGQIGPWVRQQLADLDAAHEATIGGNRAALDQAGNAAAQITTPHQAGAAVRGAVEAARAPAVSAADAAVARAQSGAEGALAGLGGDTATQSMQGHGARMRGSADAGTGLEGMKAPVKAAAGRAFNWIDPDGTLALDVSAIRDAAKELIGEVNPRMGGRLTEAEGPLKAAAGLRNVELFSDIRDLRSHVGEALRAMRRAGEAETRPYRRMSVLMQSIDDTIVKAAEDAHAAEGGAGPLSDAMVANGLERRGRSGVPDGGDTGQSGGARGLAPSGRTDGEPAQGQPASASGGAVSTEAAVGRRPESLHDFLISRGGIQDQGGDLRANDLHLVHHQGGGRLVNPNGLPLDRARELAAEAGFIRPNADINEFLDAVTARSPVYRMEDQAIGDARLRNAAGARRDASDRFMAGVNIQDAADALGVRLSRAEMDHAIDLHGAGVSPDDAVRQAVSHTENTVLQRNAEANAFGSPGVPLAAQQSEMGIGRNSGLTPNFTQAARDQMRAANAGYREYKDRFGSGAVGDVLASGKENGYRLAESQVPRALFNGGAKGAEAADSLIKAAGSREKALDIFGDYPAFSLRAKAEEMGTLSVPKYEAWLRDNKAVMDKFPELRARFDTAAKARAALDELKAKRIALDDANPIRPGWGDAEVMSRLVVPGPNGHEAAAALIRETGGSQRARDATRDYLAWSLRDAAEIKSGPRAGELDKKAYDRWMRQYDAFLSHPDMASVKSSFRSLGAAQEALDQSVAAHAEARRAFENSVARHFLGDADPVTSMGAILRSGTAKPQMTELMRLTARDPTARQSIQRAAIEYILREMKSNQSAGSDLNALYLKNDALQTFIRRHIGADGEGALRQILSRDQIDALNNVALDMRRSNLSISGNKAPNGSDTSSNLSAMASHDHRPSTASMLAMLEVAGEGGAHLGGPFAKIAAMIGVPAINAMRQRGFAHVDDLIAEALLHPKEMSALLEKIPVAAAAPSRLAALKSQMAALAANSAIQEAYRGQK